MDNNSFDLPDNKAFFDSINFNDELERIYEIIGDGDLQKDLDDNINLTNIRNDNYNRYKSLDMSKYKSLPSQFDSIVEEMNELYNGIDMKNILNDNYEDSQNIKAVLDNIDRRIFRLENMIRSYIKEKARENDKKQANFKLSYIKNLDIDPDVKKQMIEKYNDLVLVSSNFTEDIYEELDIQVKRNKYINEIYELINLEKQRIQSQITETRLEPLNRVVNLQINTYKEKITYLEDLIPENSKYTDEFNRFKDFFNKLIAYDDTNYEEVKRLNEILSDDERLKKNILGFETLFINEIDERKKEEKFIFEKVGTKNLKTSLNYIVANYINCLSDNDKKVLQYIYNSINDDTRIEEFNRLLGSVVNNIWKKEITDVYSFDSNANYKFICSNNQFIDAKYQTILITKRELELIKDYEDYQIGFICGYNDNIMYITENEDIMTVEYDDMSNLKTPAQLEQEFLNFKVCNRIALDGYKTKIQAVYFISDGDTSKYLKALELANMYKLPLIELKK